MPDGLVFVAEGPLRVACGHVRLRDVGQCPVLRVPATLGWPQVVNRWGSTTSGIGRLAWWPLLAPSGLAAPAAMGGLQTDLPGKEQRLGVGDEYLPRDLPLPSHSNVSSINSASSDI